MGGMKDNVAQLLRDHTEEIANNDFDGLYEDNRGIYPPDITKVLVQAVGLEKTLRGVEKIYSSMFNVEIPEQENQVDLKLPNNIKEIGDAAFSGCINLKSIDTGNGVYVIRKNAFWACFNLEDVVIGEVCKVIEESAFESCRNIKNIRFPSTITKLDPNIFKVDFPANIENVYVPKSNYRANKKMWDDALKELIDSDVVKFY